MLVRLIRCLVPELVSPELVVTGIKCAGDKLCCGLARQLSEVE